MTSGTTVTIDVGTTAIKLFLYQAKQVIYQQEIQLTTYSETNGKSYQKPDELLNSLRTGLQALLQQTASPIDYIAVSTAMHSLLPVFEHGYGEILIWSDKQAADSVAAFKKTSFSQQVYEKTGTPIHYMSPFSKLLWIKEEAPFSLPVKKWIGLKELITDFFTGEYLLDYSTASATGLFNSIIMDWDDEILDFLKIKREQLPQLVDTDTILDIKNYRKSDLGLRNETKLLIGASDGCLAAFAGYLNTGLQTSITLGTSGAVRKLSSTRQLDSKGTTFCYYLKKDLWVCGGPSNNGGTVLEWVSRLFFDTPATLFEHLDSILDTVPIGSNGLQFLPYINGERAPLWAPHINGTFQGITTTHGRSDFIRAVIEGMLLNLKFIMETNQISDEEVSINGGVFRHAKLAQLAADILGKDCLLSIQNEPGFGLLGLLDSSLEQHATPSFQLIKKDEERTEQYQLIYKAFAEKVDTYRDSYL